MSTPPTNNPQTQTEASPPPQTGGCPFKHPAEIPAAPAGCPVLERDNPAFLQNAHHTYAMLREQGPVVRAPFAQTPLDGVRQDSRAPKQTGVVNQRLFVTRYDEAVEALLDERLSSDFRKGLPPEQRERLAYMPEEAKPLAYSLIMRDAPEHTRLRKLVQPSFTARAMEALRPSIQKITDALLDRAERDAAERGETGPNRRMNLVKAFAHPLPVTVISEMLGIPKEDQAQISAEADRLMNDESLGRDEKRRERFRAFSHYMEQLFERKRKAPGDDMISQMLMTAEDGDKLSHDEMMSMVFLLFFAGHITTVNLIGSGVVALLTHPEQHAKMIADPTLAKGLVEETLRYWGPVDFMGTARLVTDDVKLGETPIAKGELVMIGLASANRDPEKFPNPDAFDITRPEAHRNIAFGKGIHVCLGAPLARLEGQIAFETLFRRYPQMRLAVPVEELKWGVGAGSGAGLRGFSQIPVFF